MILAGNGSHPWPSIASFQTNSKMQLAGWILRNWELLSKIQLYGSTKQLVDCNALDKGQLFHGTKIIDGVLGKKDPDKKNQHIEITEADKKNFGAFDIVIADLPYVDTAPDTAFERAFFDPGHNSHKTLLLMISKCDWIKDDGMLITSFSTLGGLEDLARFERLISECNLQTIQRFSFYEHGYLWMVYCIARKSHFDHENYWWKKLKANQISVNST